jgi:hypothetical protein
METFPRLRRELRIAENPERLTAYLVNELPRHGAFIEQHYPGLRVVAKALRPMSLSWGAEIRIDLRPLDAGHVEVVIESRFQFPWMDFSHENLKNLDLVEELLNTRDLEPSRPASPAKTTPDLHA